MQTRHEQSSDVDVSILYIITRYFVYHVHKVTVFKRSYQEQSQDKAPTAKIYARKRASWCPYWISCRPTTAAPSDIQNHQLLQHSCKPNNHREALSISIKVVAVSEITMKINSAVMTANDLTIHASCWTVECISEKYRICRSLSTLCHSHRTLKCLESPWNHLLRLESWIIQNACNRVVLCAWSKVSDINRDYALYVPIREWVFSVVSMYQYESGVFSGFQACTCTHPRSTSFFQAFLLDDEWSTNEGRTWKCQKEPLPLLISHHTYNAWCVSCIQNCFGHDHFFACLQRPQTCNMKSLLIQFKESIQML